MEMNGLVLEICVQLYAKWQMADGWWSSLNTSAFFHILSKRTCCLRDRKVVSGRSVDPLVTLYRGYTSTFPFLKYREWTTVKIYLCDVIKGWAPCVLVIFIDGLFGKCEEELWELANLNPWLPLSLSSGISYISVSVLLQELAVLPVRTHTLCHRSTDYRLHFHGARGSAGPWSDCCAVIIFSGFVTLTFSEGRWR